MSAPRGLSAEEIAAWEKLAATVTPLVPQKRVRQRSHEPDRAPAPVPPPVATAARAGRSAPAPRPPAASPAPVRSQAPGGGLDSHWERRFKGGVIAPDFTLDLHGCSLAQAHARLEHGLAQACAMEARVVLLIAGKPRPVHAADRAEQRGAIRAKLLDWLAAGPFASDIAAIRSAHRRHGGEGALYLILKRRR